MKIDNFHELKFKGNALKVNCHIEKGFNVSFARHETTLCNFYFMFLLMKCLITQIVDPLRKQFKLVVLNYFEISQHLMEQKTISQILDKIVALANLSKIYIFWEYLINTLLVPKQWLGSTELAACYIVKNKREGIIVPLDWQSGQLKSTQPGPVPAPGRLLHWRQCR